jgi:hypothetical protein
VVRTFRTLAGIALVLVGFPCLLVGVGGLLAMQHRDDDGAFTAQLAPIHTDGYAVIVPDVNATMTRFGIGPLLGSGEVKIALRSSTAAILMAIAPRSDVQRYLDGVAHTEVASVGYADGDAPVTAHPYIGIRPPAPPRDQAFWGLAGTESLDWELGPGQPLSLVLLRADGQPGFDLTLAVSRYADWIKPATVGLLVAGLAGLLGGLVLLFMAAEPVLVVEAHRMVEFADRIAERLEQIAPGESLAVVRRTRGLDLTGELVPVSSDRSRGRPSSDRWSTMPRYRSAHASESAPGQAPPPDRADRGAPDDLPDDDFPDAGQSPYIYTAT